MGQLLIELMLWPFLDAGTESPRWMRIVGALLWLMMGALLIVMVLALSGALG